MPPSFNQWRDKSRHVLHQLSRRLGEKVSAKPASLDDKAKAEETLSLELPAFKSLLPYETMDENSLFINACSEGFGLHLLPSSGADESLMQTLSTLFKNKLPEGCDCTVLLYKHHYLANQLAASFVPILGQGGILAECARLSLDHHTKAIKSGYKNGRNVPAQLTDYRGYLFLSLPKSSDSQIRLKHLREEWESELKVAGLATARMNSHDFQILLRTLVSPNRNAIAWPEISGSEEKGTDEFIRDRIPHPSSVYRIQEDYIDVSSLDEEGRAHCTRLINCEVVEWPKSNNPFALWQTPDLFANRLKPEQGIQCPFLLSMTIRGQDLEKVKALAKRRAKSTHANNNAIQNFLNPGLNDEAQEWQLVHEEVTQGDLALYPVFYNLILYTTEDNAREHVAKAISSYRQLGFTLIPSRCKQWLRFLASLPFLLTERLFTPLNLMGMMKPLSHYNVANLLPVIADFKGSQQGLLLPTYRHQLFFYDPFDDKNLPITNYNRLTVASTGAGKSYLQQALLLDGLSRGHQIFVIDLGASYKHLCQLVGGAYIDATTITLNPFTLFDFDGVAEINGETVNNYIQIRDLIAIMASPEQGLDEVQKDWLLQAILMCWRKLGKKACMDDVLAALRAILQQPEARDDRRLKDLIVLLSKYGREGLYGTMFNGETPLLNNSRFTVLELGGFESNPQLLTIVMYVMIVIIQGQFYHADRRLKNNATLMKCGGYLPQTLIRLLQIS